MGRDRYLITSGQRIKPPSPDRSPSQRVHVQAGGIGIAVVGPEKTKPAVHAGLDANAPPGTRTPNQLIKSYNGQPLETLQTVPENRAKF